MKAINSYLTEKLKINKDTVSKGPVYNYHPKSKNELRRLLRKLLEERGKDADLNDIDTSGVTDMEGIFGNLDPHNIDISLWDVYNVTNMKFMFYGCKNFNCNLSGWDVSRVKNMLGMFYQCYEFNSDLSRWDVSKVEDMGDMFKYCDSLKNIPSWYKK